MTAELRPVPAIRELSAGTKTEAERRLGRRGVGKDFRMPTLPLRNIPRPEKAKRSDSCGISGEGRHL